MFLTDKIGSGTLPNGVEPFRRRKVLPPKNFFVSEKFLKIEKAREGGLRGRQTGREVFLIKSYEFSVTTSEDTL